MRNLILLLKFFNQISTNATTLHTCVLATPLVSTHLVLMSVSVSMGLEEMDMIVPVR